MTRPPIRRRYLVPVFLLPVVVMMTMGLRAWAHAGPPPDRDALRATRGVVVEAHMSQRFWPDLMLVVRSGPDRSRFRHHLVAQRLRARGVPRVGDEVLVLADADGEIWELHVGGERRIRYEEAVRVLPGRFTRQVAGIVLIGAVLSLPALLAASSLGAPRRRRPGEEAA